MSVADPVPVRTRPSWVTLAYFYIAALIGLTIVITGLIIAVNAFFDAVFFEAPSGTSNEFDSYFDQSRGDKVRSGFKALLICGVGFPIMCWHLKEARKVEGAASRA